jgi:hypothetical protein
MELKGKPLSLGAKILAVVIAIGALALKATISPQLDIDAALKTAAFVALIFAPIDVSLVISNILGPLGLARKSSSAPYQADYAQTGGGR